VQCIDVPQRNIGDVKEVILDISKMEGLGWKPKYNSEEAIRLAFSDRLGIES